MQARRAITSFFRACMRVFFKRIELMGLERVPDGPVIFAVNHPNGLVDPLFLVCFVPRPVSFLAKAPLFRYPVIGWCVRTFQSIPVYRKQDNMAGTHQQTFAQARQVLAGEGSVAIFPEGTTHSDPQLRELKTGAARIALGAGLPRVSVVPAGIYYTAKHIFRSSALVVFGEPLDVHPDPALSGQEPPVAEVEALTAKIDAGLDAVTLQADSHAALELVARAEDFFSATADQPLSEEFDLRRRFIAGYHFLCARQPARLQKLQSLLSQFEAELRHLGVEVHELATGFRAPAWLKVLVLLPLAVPGVVLNWPTYRAVGLLAARLSKGDGEMVATMKFLSALLLFPITWLVLSIAVGLRTNAVAAGVTFVILPILGWIALRAFEELDSLIGEVRALQHRYSRDHRYARAIVLRDALRKELIAVAEEMDKDSALVQITKPPA